MPIKAKKGSIFDISGQPVEAMVLWLRGGFNARSASWSFEMPKVVKSIESRELNGKSELRPWLRPEDSLLQVEPIEESPLKYIYVFSNPENKQGYSKLQIEQGIQSALNQLHEKGIKVISFMHIPLMNQEGVKPTKDEDERSARIMIQTINSWLKKNDGDHDIILVDLEGDFENLIEN